MPYVALEFMPGVYRPATRSQAVRRWFDTQLVRWRESGPAPVMQPVGGWRVAIAPFDGDVGIFDGNPPHGLMAYRTTETFPGLDIADKTAVWIGTEDNVYLYIISANGAYTSENTRTPDDYIGGPVEEDVGVDTLVTQNFWQFDLFGTWPVGVAQSDQRLWYWEGLIADALPVLDEAEANITGRSLVVTPEKFLVAIGADGNQRLVRWSGQADLAVWTAAEDNQAGSFEIETKGVLMCGRAGRKETLIWSDVDLWGMRYIAGTLIYSFEKLGNNCGTISARAVAMKDSGAVWMGRDSFFIYDGFVRPLSCPVADFVFGHYTDEELPAGAGFNREQRAKVAAVHNPDFHEVTWYYPSDGADDNDRYVTYNYVSDIWMIGAIPRSDGIHTLHGPLLGGLDGYVYLHEQYGEPWVDADDTTYVPRAESGPLQIGEGDQVMHLLEYIPDEQNLGRASITLKTSMQPTTTETDTALTIAAPTMVRRVGRFVRLVVTTTTQGDMWRLGRPKLDVREGGRR